MGKLRRNARQIPKRGIGKVLDRRSILYRLARCPMQQHKDRFFKNTLASLFTPFLPLVISFFMMPFIINHIGRDAFGVWALSLSLVGYAGLLDMGFMQTTVKRVAEFLAAKDKEQLCVFCSRVLVLYTLLGLMIAVAFFLLSRFALTALFNVPVDLEEQARLAFYIIGIQAALSFPARLWEGVVQGMQRFVFFMTIIYISSGLQALLIYLLLSHGYGIVALATTSLIASLIKWLSFYVFSLRKLPDLRIHPHLSDLKPGALSPIITFSIQFFILQACSMIILHTDRLIIGIFFPIAALTTYEIALRIHDVIRTIVSSIQIIVLPAASEFHALKQKENLQKIVLRGTKFIFILFFLIAVPVAILSRQFIIWWIGEDLGNSAQILVILLFAQMFNALNFVTGQVFLGMWKTKVYIWVRVLSAVLNVVFSIVLLKIFGLVGVALGTALQFAVTDIPLLIYFLNQLEIRKTVFLKECILSTIPSAVISGGLLSAFTFGVSWAENNQNVLIIVGALLYAFVYILLISIIGFDRRERGEIKTAVISIARELNICNKHPISKK